MMKQPAENTNATAFDEKRSAERTIPARNPAVEYQEIEDEARRISAQREGDGRCTNDEWNHAAEIVRNRKTSLSKA
jgi:hypothetical protein